MAGASTEGLGWPQGIGLCQLASLCRRRLAPGNTGPLGAGWADVWGGQRHTRRPSAHTVGVCRDSWPSLILPGSSRQTGWHLPPSTSLGLPTWIFLGEVAMGHI